MSRVELGALTLIFAIIFSLNSEAEEFRIDRFFVIGDSLSDAGTYSQGVSFVSGGSLPSGLRYRFTTNALDNSSLTWAEHTAKFLGLEMGPDVLQGVPIGFIPSVDINGGNYSEGGSRVNDQPGVICTTYSITRLYNTTRLGSGR